MHRGQGGWKYLYRAVEKHGKTVDFLLIAKRDMDATKRFLDKAIEANETPPIDVTDPLPPGAETADDTKARDPVGIANCVIGYYRVSISMFQGCAMMRSPTSARLCRERSFTAYSKNLHDECYANYW